MLTKFGIRFFRGKSFWEAEVGRMEWECDEEYWSSILFFFNPIIFIHTLRLLGIENQGSRMHSWEEVVFASPKRQNT